MKKPILNHQRAAFSLIELVVVVAIIAIISTFTVPAALTIIRGSAMTQASQMLTDQISLARQLALSKNRTVEVRLYAYADPEAPGENPSASVNASNPTGNNAAQFRGFQLFEVVPSGVPVPLDKPQRLPSTVVMNPALLSTLLSYGTQAAPYKVPTSQDPQLPRGVGANYVYSSFRFLPDGSTNLLATGNWYLTLVGLTDKISGSTPPKNFFTLQIDPVSGSTKGFRPTAG